MIHIVNSQTMNDFELTLLIFYQIRWQAWTGKSPWQLNSDSSIGLAVAFLLFVFYPVVLLIRRNR